MTISASCPRCGPAARTALGAARYRCTNPVVVGMAPPPLLGTGLDRVPLFDTSFSAYPDVVVEGALGRRVWKPDRLVRSGEYVTVDGWSWAVIGEAEEPVGPPTPIYRECGVDYVDLAEAALLLG